MSRLVGGSARWFMGGGAILLASCAGPGIATGPGFTGVSYTLAFDTTGIERQDDGWSVHTDLGYTVRITEGSLTTVGTSLVACADVVARAPLQRLWPTAHAGHPGEVDPSTWSSPVTEDLVLAEPISPGGIEFPAERYCRVHYLVYQATETTSGSAPVDKGLTLRLVGELTDPQGITEPLNLSTGDAHGALLDLDDEMLQEGTLDLVIRRPLAAAFNGVDFSSDPDPAFSVLGNLMELSLQVSVDGSR